MSEFIAELGPFFLWLLKSTTQASVLICVILFVQILFGKKLGLRWYYCLWMLLIVRMLLPWSPQSKASVYNFVPEAGQVKTTFEHITQKPFVVNNDITGEPTATPLTAGQNHTKPVHRSEAASAQSTSVLPFSSLSVDPGFVLRFVWAVGAGLLTCVVFAGNFKLWRIVKSKRPVTDQKVLEMLEDCKSQMGIETILAIVETKKIQSPALFGFIRPRLLLPEGMLKSLTLQELEHIFLHELAHLKRFDIYLGWVMAILQVLHWFNPMVWFAFYRVRADRELACDGLALSTMGTDQPGQYGQTIVSLLERFSRQSRLPSMAGILEDRSQIKRRIASIAKFKKSSYKWSPLAVIVLVVIGFVTLSDAHNTKGNQPGFLVKGVVTDAVTGKPIAGARVGDDGYAGGQQWTITDSQGMYSYPTWYEEHGIKAEADGYSSSRETLLTKMFRSEKEKTIDFVLRPGAKRTTRRRAVSRPTTRSSRTVTRTRPKPAARTTSSPARGAMRHVRKKNVNKDVSFEVTRSDFKQGDSIEITSITGTSSKLKVGETYIIKGKYDLASHDRAMLHIYATNGQTYSDQGSDAIKGSGEFSRNFRFLEDGQLHLSFYPDGRGGSSFGNLYFANPSGQVDIAASDFEFRYNQERGTHNLLVSIVNNGDVTIPKFKHRFYKGDVADDLNETGRAHRTKVADWYNAGPIEPGGTLGSRSMGFNLPDGEYTFGVVLDYDNAVAESDESNNIATLNVIIKDGKIAKTFDQHVTVSAIEKINFAGDDIIRFEANAEAGFNFPFYVFVPKAVDKDQKVRLLVESNNTGTASDDLGVHQEKALRSVSRSYPNRIARRLGSPLLVPVFPRPRTNWQAYTHSLDRDTLEIDEGQLNRIDLQLTAMIKYAQQFLRVNGFKIDDQIFMHGFSASAKFCNRYSYLHPEMVKAVASGGVNGLPTLPVSNWNGFELPFPIGTSGIERFTNKPFNEKAFRQVAHYIYMGSFDRNDTLPSRDAWSEKEADIIKKALAEKMMPDRWELTQKIYKDQNINAQCITYNGVAHGIEREMLDDVVKFFEVNSGDKYVPIEPHQYPFVEYKQIKQAHVNGLYWYDDDRLPEWIKKNSKQKTFLIGIEEWNEGQDHRQLVEFCENAGFNFVLKAEGQKDILIRAEGYPGSTSQGDGRFQAFFAKLNDSQFGQIIPGVSYKLEALNDSNEYFWTVNDGVTLTKDGKAAKTFDQHVTVSAIEKINFTLEAGAKGDLRVDTAPDDLNTKNKSYSSEFADGSFLEINVDSGNCKVKGVEGDQLKINAVINARASSDEEIRRLIKETKIEFKKTDDGIKVVSKNPKLKSGESVTVNVNVIVPVKAKLTLNVGMGNVDCQNIAGDIKCKVGMGNIEVRCVERIVNAKLNMGMGNVVLNVPADVSAKVSVKLGMGTLESSLPLNIKGMGVTGESGKTTFGGGGGKMGGMMGKSGESTFGGGGGSGGGRMGGMTGKSGKATFGGGKGNIDISNGMGNIIINAEKD